MQRVTRFALIAVLLAAAPAVAGDFFALLEDVPVMPGLQPVEDAGIEFDAPSGRIVEAYAIGALERGAVRRIVQSGRSTFYCAAHQR